MWSRALGAERQLGLRSVTSLPLPPSGGVSPHLVEDLRPCVEGHRGREGEAEKDPATGRKGQ